MSEEVFEPEEEERRKLEEIHAGIEREIAENVPFPDLTLTQDRPYLRGGAVPRMLSAYGERSPGDTSPDAPEGTPTREEGLFQQSRGEGLPMTRAGGPAVSSSETPEEKRRYWEQKNARLKAQVEAEDKRQQEKLERRRGAEFLQDCQQPRQGAGLRQVHQRRAAKDAADERET